MTIGSARQAEQTVGIRRRGTNLDGRSLTVKQRKSRSLRLRSKPAHNIETGLLSIAPSRQAGRVTGGLLHGIPYHRQVRGRGSSEFDAEAVRELKAAARVLTVGGAELAAQAIAAGLVDAYQLFRVPLLVGGGKRVFPDDRLRHNLELLEERRFRNGTVYLHYRTAGWDVRRRVAV
jgi:riboflavin biosynthesis pyrimidine reductase